MSELCEKPAVDLRRMIGSRQISPIDLVESCIRRIESIDPAINAVVSMCVGRARDEARRAEIALMKGQSLGVLHGLPLGIKDLEATEGLRTTYGSLLYRDHVPTEDSPLTRRLRRAGGIVLAKTNVPELGAGGNTVNPVSGATGNPWDPNRTSGGSSGGSAAVLATDMLPLATGSDTGASIRVPAAFCGVVGFRPSPGRIPSAASHNGWSPITVFGPMARSVGDVRLLHSAMIAFDSRDPLSNPESVEDRSRVVDLATLRVGVSEDLGVCHISAAMRQEFRRRVECLSDVVGAVQEVKPDFAGGQEAFTTLSTLNFISRHHERVRTVPDALPPKIVEVVKNGLQLSALDISAAFEAQTRMYRSHQALFESIDVLICPTVATSPFPWTQDFLREVDGRTFDNYFQWLAPTFLFSLIGQPCLSLPAGLGADGFPMGIQLVGSAHGDGYLLDIACALEAFFESTSDMARPRPNLAALAKAPRLKPAQGLG